MFSPTPTMLKSRHIADATSLNPHASPYPFGLGIYATSGTNGEDLPIKKRLLPMMYVSEVAAKDRENASEQLNTTRVRAGWYVIAEPGTHFQVHYTRVNESRTKDLKEDLLKAQLYVDGMKACAGEHFHQDGCANGETIVSGFQTRGTAGSKCKDMKAERQIMHGFKFTNTKSVDTEAETHEKVGTIWLEVLVGTAGPRPNKKKVTRYEKDMKIPTRGVTEEHFKHDGKSLQIGLTDNFLEREAQRSHFSLCHSRRWAEAEIIVYVREMWWMQSRYLIDGDGVPYTYEMLDTLLEADLPDAKASTEKMGVHRGAYAGIRKRKRKGTLLSSRKYATKGNAD